MLRSWFPEGVYVWDLVAAVNTTNPSLCQQAQLHVEVLTAAGNEEGRTRVVEGQPPNVAACLAPGAAAMKARVADTFGDP
jgi:inosine-uridine nucleoside N-ribohydrolase